LNEYLEFDEDFPDEYDEMHKAEAEFRRFEKGEIYKQRYRERLALKQQNLKDPEVNII
jgi:hypothetical protein